MLRFLNLCSAPAGPVAALTILAAALSVPASAQGLHVDYQPDGAGAWPSGVGATPAAAASYIPASAATRQVDRVTWWGAYAGAAPAGESFDVVFHDPIANYVFPSTPGPEVAAARGVTATRTATGGTVQYAGASYPEYRFELEIPGGLTLPPDSYYVEVVQTASSGGGQFLWASATPAPGTPSDPGVSVSDTAPGPLLSWQWTANWYYTGIHHLALRLEEGSAAPTPTLSLPGSCGGFLLQLDGEGFTPGGTVHLGWAPQTGALTLAGGPCAGTTLGLMGPRYYGAVGADAMGAFQLAPTNVPPAACGSVYVQAVDAASCVPSNVVAL